MPFMYIRENVQYAVRTCALRFWKKSHVKHPQGTFSCKVGQVKIILCPWCWNESELCFISLEMPSELKIFYSASSGFFQMSVRWCYTSRHATNISLKTCLRSFSIRIITVNGSSLESSFIINSCNKQLCCSCFISHNITAYGFRLYYHQAESVFSPGCDDGF